MTNCREPYWWALARQLHEEGLSIGKIAPLVQKDRAAVRYVVVPEYRNRRLAQMKFRGTQSRHRAIYLDRAKMLEYAREEALASNVNIDVVLMRWGEPPRRAFSRLAAESQ